MSFWESLPRPFFAMAPLKDVTDAAFRALVAKRGKPDVFWTEFVAADGLYHLCEIQKVPDAKNPLMRDLTFDANQHPIVAQIFSSKPEMIAYATELISRLGSDVGSRGPNRERRGFDGVDINMGCPDRTVEKQGAGAALIKNPKRAQNIIRAAQEASSLPVSVKTRIGYNKESLDEWLTALLEMRPAAITLHLRTRKEMSAVPADWERMKLAIALRNKLSPETLLIGNGDVKSLEEGKQLAGEAGCDGIMIGRGIFGNPWLFSRSGNNPERSRGSQSLEEKLKALTELAHSFEKLSPPKSFAILKKHIKAFVTGFPGAADLRVRFMKAENAAELENQIKTFL